MSKHHHLSRRKFLGRVTMGCAALGVTPLYSGITNMGLLNAAAAANRTSNTKGDYKGLVCIMLSGGNDSFNMLVPKGESEYNEYQSIRGNLAIPQSELLSINPQNTNGMEFGLHPSLQNTQQMFESGNAAFVTNVGALLEPFTRSSYQDDTPLPIGLFSHSDQRRHWQTCVPQNVDSLGWGGRLADILYTNNANQDVSMNISLDGVNVFQRGNIIKEFAIGYQDNGSVILNGAEENDFYNQLKRQTLDNLLDQEYHNILKTAYANTITDSNNSSFSFNSAIANGMQIATEFGADVFSQKLLMVAKTIAARDILGVSNQTFFIELSGWDTHDELLDDHSLLLSQLDTAIGSFNEAMAELGVANDVVSFTMSDFGRKLPSNGDGTDHGWGGHSLVFGNAVSGQKLYGEFPDLFLDNDLDLGGGRIIPTTSCDEYFAELALWFGASHSDLDQILPNINNFWTPNADGPLGMF